MVMFPSLETFVLIVGNARSGSTLLGGLLDGHPEVVVANETAASATFWRGLGREAILREILDNAAQQAATGRVSEGYTYQIGPGPETKPLARVVGDKVWNPATLLLHGDHGLIPSLEQRMAVPVRIVHAIRDPFDTIATMQRRSGAPLGDRIRWYFMHCDAAAAIRDRLPADRFLDTYHDDLLRSPAEELDRLCRFLGLASDAEHQAAARRLLFERPRRTRNVAPWSAADIDAVRAGMDRFPWLERYAEASGA